MVKLNAPYRYATPEDAAPLAELVNFAGEGMPLYSWSKMAGDGESPWDIGRQRAQRETGSFSYRNSIVRQDGDRVSAVLVGYALPEEPEPIDYDEMPAMFVPLQELEDLAAGTWYVNVLATYPDFRGKGYGSDLLAIAEQLAVATNTAGLSLIVSDGNPGARRLYEKSGYSEVATRPMVKQEWENPGETWVLMEQRFR